MYKKLKGQIEQISKENDFSGVVSIYKGEESLYERAFGFRDVDKELMIDLDTRFGIASGTKFVTSLAVSVLVESGTLSFNAKVGDLDSSFKGFIDPEATIWHVLCHTSGMYDYYDEDLVPDMENFYIEIPWSFLESPLDYLPLFRKRKMKGRAGIGYAYCNGGYVLLGAIIEKITGMTYGEFVQGHVLGPAGMSDSGFFRLDQLPSNTARGILNDRKTTNTFRIPICGGGDGGMYTSSRDIRKLWRAYYDCELLDRSTRDELSKVYGKYNRYLDIACSAYRGVGKEFYFIEGCDAGVGFFSKYSPNDDVVFSVLSNVTAGAGCFEDVALEMG
ncbi:serine hydrolase domain-containing protein [Pelagicoccus sp. SDUM812002]|uniref:serine hydrolase domain-containing protein n=1 Tax=Pelagicoccus sp. SDUM812002 TaxID=3041266 RepID=UPI00280EC627|nr:serine hydrolase domain-containing protein [Pelagicoccus sp. SDUM812002]MDQ8188584.1 serine hydrolase [Pelagicoccus sp. SDUM812002]